MPPELRRYTVLSCLDMISGSLAIMSIGVSLQEIWWSGEACAPLVQPSPNSLVALTSAPISRWLPRELIDLVRTFLLALMSGDGSTSSRRIGLN